jgi:hypothetical protein
MRRRVVRARPWLAACAAGEHARDLVIVHPEDLDIDGELDANTSLGEADQVGAQVIEAVHRAVDETRLVRWSAHGSVRS